MPAQQAAIDADYHALLGKIPDGPAKTAGIALGEQAAAAIVAAVAFLPFARGLLAGQAFFFRDLSLHFFPLRRFALEGLRAGELHLVDQLLARLQLPLLLGAGPRADSPTIRDSITTCGVAVSRLSISCRTAGRYVGISRMIKVFVRWSTTIAPRLDITLWSVGTISEALA